MSARKGNISSLTLASISQRCAEESELFFSRLPNDPRFCYELFRRAILNRDELAWERVFSQYKPLITGWVNRHSAFPECGEETMYFVNRAMEKMWSAITPERFHTFNDLKSLLRYLQLCVHSVILDHVRMMERSRLETDVDLDSFEMASQGPPLEDRALKTVYRQEFWSVIESRLKDEKERKVVFGSYVLDLKPGQIYDQYSTFFRDVNEIYRIKENVLTRLRRDVELLNLLA